MLPAQKKILITANVELEREVSVPANWTGDQIQGYVDNITVENLFEYYDIKEIDFYWKLKSKEGNNNDRK